MLVSTAICFEDPQCASIVDENTHTFPPKITAACNILHAHKRGGYVNIEQRGQLPTFMRNTSLYCVPSPCIWQKGKQIPVLNSVSARSSRWALPIGANPGLLKATPPALPASQDCIFYLSLLGFIFAEHSILGCNQPRNPPRARRLVISHRRSSEWGAHKGEKSESKAESST